MDLSSVTIADLRAAGLTHLEVSCEGCHCIKAIPWELLPHIPQQARYGDVVERLRCSACGEKPKPENVRPWSQRLAHGAGTL